MYSLSFPDMIDKNGIKTKLYSDHDATFSNLKLLLSSMKGELFGDPDFGTELKRKIFENGTSVLSDLIIDDLYVSVLTFMPQLLLKRGDINVTYDGVNVYVSIKCTNLIDHQTNMYTINLTEQ